MIEISFKGDTPLEALSKAAAFGLHAAEDKTVLDAARQIMKAEKGARVQSPATAPPPPTAPAQEPSKKAAKDAKPTEKPAANPPPATDAAPAQDAAESGPTAPRGKAPDGEGERVPTLEEIKDKGKEAARKYGRDAVLPLLKEFNAPRISEVAEKDRAAFIARLERLGEADA